MSRRELYFHGKSSIRPWRWEWAFDTLTCTECRWRNSINWKEHRLRHSRFPCGSMAFLLRQKIKTWRTTILSESTSKQCVVKLVAMASYIQSWPSALGRPSTPCPIRSRSREHSVSCVYSAATWRWSRLHSLLCAKLACLHALSTSRYSNCFVLGREAMSRRPSGWPRPSLNRSEPPTDWRCVPQGKPTRNFKGFDHFRGANPPPLPHSAAGTLLSVRVLQTRSTLGFDFGADFGVAQCVPSITVIPDIKNPIFSQPRWRDRNSAFFRLYTVATYVKTF